jgi:hypothetical protein
MNVFELRCKNAKCSATFKVSKFTYDEFCCIPCKNVAVQFRSKEQCLIKIHKESVNVGIVGMPIQNLGPSARRERNDNLVKSWSQPVNLEKNKEYGSNNGDTEMQKNIVSTKDNITKTMPTACVLVSEKDDAAVIPHEGFTQLSNKLLTERSNAIKQLTSSATQLIELATSLMGEVKDEKGEVIRRNPTCNTEAAVKCFDVARNMLKTNLEYLKFGKELAESELIKGKDL